MFKMKIMNTKTHPFLMTTCYSLLWSFHTSTLCISSQLLFSDQTLVAWHWPRWAYLHIKESNAINQGLICRFADCLGSPLYLTDFDVPSTWCWPETKVVVKRCLLKLCKYMKTWMNGWMNEPRIPLNPIIACCLRRRVQGRVQAVWRKTSVWTLAPPLGGYLEPLCLGLVSQDKTIQ